MIRLPLLTAIMVLTAFTAAIPARADAQENAVIAALRASDQRLASIADPMLRANAHLCRDKMPITGVVFHSADQYRAEAGAAFREGEPVAVSAIIPGSPAATAGILPDDGVSAISGTVLDGQKGSARHLRGRAFDLLAAIPPGEPIALMLRRKGAPLEREIVAPAGCRVLVEVWAEDDMKARADGQTVQLSHGLLSTVSDDEIAVVLAHELAHIILNHRQRLSDAGVTKGLFGEFGRNRRLNRQAEAEADRLSAHLLANAGFNPSIAPAFWRSEIGQEIGGGAFRSRAYPSPQTRAEQIEEEIRLHLAASSGLSVPEHLLSLRDQPME